MNQNLEEISDGKKYELNDMVRAACNDCAGCFSCCENMGESIVLDPLDIYQITKYVSCSFNELLDKQIKLHAKGGMILPHLEMTEEKNCCPFLSDAGRCTIHKFRPGICRIFPLGRVFEDGKLWYFLQKDGCIKQNKSKVKVSKWLDTPKLKENQQYIIDWHDFRKKIEQILLEVTDEKKQKTIAMFLLHTFYITPYDTDVDFYPQFYDRLEKIRQAIL